MIHVLNGVDIIPFPVADIPEAGLPIGWTGGVEAAKTIECGGIHTYGDTPWTTLLSGMSVMIPLNYPLLTAA